MSANTGFLSTTELDFNSLKSNLKSFLQKQAAFADYEYEGSNLSVLIDLLSYNTYINSHYLNQLGSESFLDTALLRESVVSHAKELNYIPRSRSSSTIVGTIEIVPSDSPAQITIPKNYQIKTTIDNKVYRFITNNSYVVKRNSAGRYVSEEITFYEGMEVAEVFTAPNTKHADGSYNPYIYPLSSENIDTSSIEVIVQESNTDSTKINFTQSDSLFGLNNLSTVFFVEGYKDNMYQLVFGNDVIGKALKLGNIVTVKYRDATGSDANGASVFSPSGPIEKYTTVYCSTTGFSKGGSERESIASIKYLAPRHFQVQERAVVEADFETIIKTKFPNIQAVTAYGGEFGEPKQYGKVIISVKPFGTSGIITNREKNQIIEHLKLKSITTEPVMVDANYFYMEINSEVQYDASLTTESDNQIKQNVINNLSDLNLSYFNDFGKDFRYSKICGIIDDSADNNSIVSNDTNVRVIKRFTPNLNEVTDFSFSYDSLMKTEGVRYQTPLGHDNIFESSEFQYLKNNVSYTVRMRDNGLGTISLYTQSGLNYVEVESNIGTIDYTTGNVQFKLAVQSYLGYISLYGRLESKDYIVSKSKFVILDPSDFNISVVRARY